MIGAICCLPAGNLWAQEITIALPQNYCALPETEDAMVLVEPCGASVGPVALLTVLVGAEGSGDAMTEPAGVVEWLNSPEGRETLSRSGRPEEVSIVELSSIGNAMLMYLRDRGGSDGWRVLASIRDRLVTLTVTPDRMMPFGQGRALAVGFLQKMQAANR